MPDISLAQARQIFTQELSSYYREINVPKSFLRSFFTDKEKSSKLVSIEVRRGTEKVAVDVQRGTEGNRNTFSKSSMKVFEPPYYREYFDMTDLDFYDAMVSNNGTVSVATFNEWLGEAADNVMELQFKIERAYELQCKQVLETGVVTTKDGDNIDFKRKAASLVANGAGNTWATSTVDPIASLKAGAEFLRTKGKASGGVFNVIMGSTALSNFLNNEIIQKRSDIRHFSLDSVRAPQRNALGAALHGEVSAGAWMIRVWSYPEYYDTSSSDNNPYVDPKKIIMLPEAPKFDMTFAAVPKLMGDNSDEGAGLAGQRGAYMISEYLDKRKTAHIIDVKSAGLAIPVAVDQIYTEQVVA